MPIVVTGVTNEKLLNLAQLKNGTGLAEAEAILEEMGNCWQSSWLVLWLFMNV